MLTTEVAVCQSHPREDSESSAGDRRRRDSLGSNADAVEQRKNNGSCREAREGLGPASIESPDEVEIFCHPSDTVASLHRSTDECCSSKESFDFYGGEGDSLSNSEWNSSTSSRSSSISDNDAPPLRPGSDEELPGQTKAGTENINTGGLEEEEEEEEDRGADFSVRNKPAGEKNNRALKTCRRKRRDGAKRKKGRPEEGRAGRLDDAWSNRWLTGKEILATCWRQ